MLFHRKGRYRGQSWLVGVLTSQPRSQNAASRPRRPGSTVLRLGLGQLSGDSGFAGSELRARSRGSNVEQRSFARIRADEFARALQTIYNRCHLVINHRIAVGRQGRRRHAAAPFPFQPQWTPRGRQPGRMTATGIGLARLLALVFLLFGTSSSFARGQAVMDFPIPNGYESKGIAAGPDGKIWFAEYLKIGRVTLTGDITLFTTPTFSYSNGGIASGPDGNLWFTEQVGVIGRITPAGAIVEFQLPVDFLAPTPGAIVAGSDGNLWFTEVAIVFNGSVYGAVGRIGRITTAGLITEFPVTPLWEDWGQSCFEVMRVVGRLGSVMF
jgi:hypothetical protein